MTHLERNADLVLVAARDAVRQDVHVDASLEQVERSLKDTDVALVTCTLQWSAKGPLG